MSALLLFLTLGPLADAKPQPYCEDGWCWQAPAPMGLTLSQVAALPKGEALALSEHRLLHWRKGRWTLLHELEEPVDGLRATSLDDVWVWGSAGLLHWDGSAWNAQPLDTAMEVVDFVEADGVLTVIVQDPRARYGADMGAIVHGPDGGPFESKGVEDRPRAIASTPDGQRFVAGADTLLVRGRDDDRWRTVNDHRVHRHDPVDQLPSEGESTPELELLWTDDSGALWASGTTAGESAVILRHDARGWVPVGHDLPARTTVGGFAELDGEVRMIAQARRGRPNSAGIYTLKDRRFELDESLPTPAQPGSVHHLSTAAGTMLASGAGGLLMADRGRGWTTLAGSRSMLGLSLLSPDAAVAIGPSGLFERTKKGWRHTTDLPEGQGLWPLAVRSADEAWVADQDTLWHWDGAAWAAEPTEEKVFAVFQTAPDQAWRTGAGGTAVWDGSSWTDLAVPLPKSTAVWAGGPDDVWVGGQRAAAHFDGVSWTEHDIAAERRSNQVRAIAANSEGDLWMLTARELLHWDGSTFEPVAIEAPNEGTRPTPASIAVAEDGAVWVVGRQGLVLKRHTDGHWSQHDTPEIDLLGVRLLGSTLTVCGEGILTRDVTED